MSTNKTENLGLHSWVRKDPFRMDEFNENFDKLDRAVGANAAAVSTIPKFTCGAYTGDGKKKRLIELPFAPKMVYVGDAMGRTFYVNAAGGTYTYGGVAVEGGSNSLVEIVEGGFQVSHIENASTANYNGRTFVYFAIG